MKKLFTLFLMLAGSVGTIFAERVKIGDLYYNLDDTNFTAEITYQSNSTSNYNSLSSISIPATVTHSSDTYSVTSIGTNAFGYCSGLTSVTIPNSVTSIGNQAFFYCAGLLSITIPNSVTSIGGSAFLGCSGLTSVTIPNNVISIGGSAFANCSGLTSVTIPNSVTNIGSWAFDGCSSLTAVHISDVAAWLNISFSVFANPLNFAHNLYLNGTLVTDLIIPNSVTSISGRAFEGCSCLTSLTIPNSVTNITRGAFSSCNNLTTVTIDSDSFIKYSFSTYHVNSYFGEQVTTYILGDHVTGIGNSAFYGCSNIISITIPNSVTSIGDFAFCDCSSLTSITLPENLTNIATSLFLRCSNLTSINIPNSVISIGSGAFYGCSSLTSITIPNSVTSIGNQAFNNCSGLVSIDVEIGNSYYDSRNNCNAIIKTSSNTLLFGCQNTIIPNTVTSINNRAFYGCSRLTSVTIPYSVTSIATYAFDGCSNLSTVTIDSDTIINKPFYAYNEWGAFYITPISNIFGTQVTSYILGNHVTEVGEYAFYECSNLTTLTLSSSIDSIGTDALTGCTNLSSIYVPCGELARFQQMLPDDSRVQYVPSQYVITISEFANGHIDVPNYCSCDTSIPLTAIPDEGYHFVQWSDGNTDNPRNIELTQDTTFMAIFTIDRTGLCGKDSMLIWEFDVDSKTLTINGVGQLTENYNYGLEAPTQAMHVVIGDDVTAIGDSAFYQMATIRTVTFGENVTSIGNYAFAGLNNRNFNELDLPSGLLTIGNSAFEGCAYIETIDFGSSLESIGQNAFNGCTRVLSMICLAEITPEVGTNGLTSISSQAELYVQNDFKYRYEIDENWNRFIIKVYQEEQSTIEAIFSEEGSTTSQKVFSDGQILILRGGHVFDLTGQEVH